MSAERTLLLRLLAWGALSVLVGTGLVAWLRAGSHRSSLLWHFGLQTATWGVIEVLIALFGLGNLVPRDLAAATRLDRLLWLSIGLDVGYVFVGATLCASGWRIGRRLGPVGAGLAIIVQGSSLVLLDLLLAAQVSR